MHGRRSVAGRGNLDRTSVRGKRGRRERRTRVFPGPPLYTADRTRCIVSQKQTVLFPAQQVSKQVRPQVGSQPYVGQVQVS
jgi:hypothetical protein